MWSDNETSEDLLGFKVHADLLIDVIKDDKILPVTVGVFGDWGSGKSSILKIVKEELGKIGEDTLVLYFNGWIFEGYDDAKAALLESIVKAFDEHKTFGSKVKDKTTKLFKSIKWMRALSLGFKKIVLPTAAAYFSGGTTLLPQLATQLSTLSKNPEDLISKLQGEGAEDFLKSLIKEEGEDESMLVREFRNDFSEMIEKSSIKKLVVIIDDLDRCAPDRIIENLEAIKLFLNVEKTAFIIGADPRIVRQAIEFRYKSIVNKEVVDDTNYRIIDDYLEKLIQIPYYLPKLSDSEVETYISLLVAKRELSVEAFLKVVNAFNAFREANRYSVYGLANIKAEVTPEEYSKLSNSLISIAKLVPVITQTLSGNPRQIKRFLNTLTLRQRLATVAKISNFNDAILAKLMVLEYSEIQLFKQLYEWQILQKGVAKELLEVELFAKDKSFEEAKRGIELNYKNWSKDRVIRWLKVDPLFGNVDLSDYFWLSRDKLSSTISASSLIPPIIKNIYQKLDQEDLTSSITKSIIDQDISALTDIERASFLEMASQMLKRKPERKRGYDIFHALINEQIKDAAIYYAKALATLQLSEVPPAVGISLKNYRSNPELKHFLENVLVKSQSRVAKAFKGK